jgi:hypothetical protein
LKRYYALMYNVVFGEWIHFPINPQPTADYLSDDILAKADEYFDEAEQLAKGNPDIAYRVEAARLWIRYAKLAKPVEHIIENGLYKPVHPANLSACLRELDDFMETCRNHGITLLEEYGTPREQLMRSYYSTYKIVSLANSILKVDILPELGGRILQILNKKTGKNLLRLARVREPGYPAPIGYSDGVLAVDELNYKIDQTSGGNKIVLNGSALDYSITCKKEILLPEGKAEIEFSTVFEAQKDIERPMRIQPASAFDLYNLADIQCGFGGANSKFSFQSLPQPDQLGNVRQIYWGAAMLSNTFAIINKTENTGVLDVFDRSELEGCTVSGNPETNAIGLSLQGFLTPLKKGDIKKLHHKYVFMDNVSNF